MPQNMLEKGEDIFFKYLLNVHKVHTGLIVTDSFMV